MRKTDLARQKDRPNHKRIDLRKNLKQEGLPTIIEVLKLPLYLTDALRTKMDRYRTESQLPLAYAE